MMIFVPFNLKKKGFLVVMSTGACVNTITYQNLKNYKYKKIKCERYFVCDRMV